MLKELDLLNNSLKSCVFKIREKYSSVDLITSNLIALLKNVKDIIFFEDRVRDQIVFSLNLTELRTKIIYPGEGYSFKELVKLSNHEVIECHKARFNDILQTWVKLNIPFDCKRFSEWYDNTFTKRRSKTTITFTNGEKIAVSVVKNTYICCHYSSADLSILDDFGDLKGELNIINKSFITLGKPLQIEGFNVYIRDTVLLAPAGAGSLESLGKLYSNEGDFNKISISQDDLTQMSKFLARDKESFEAYALRDAIITLKHAISMEIFNFSIKQLGIPVTLSSVGRNFVLDS